MASGGVETGSLVATAGLAAHTQEVIAMDREGYGLRVGQSDLDHLIEDCRTLSPAGVERVASGWAHRHENPAFAQAERVALHTIEQTGRGEEWDALRNRLLGLTERGTPMVAWRTEHGEVGHRAEDALLAAALALLAQPELDHRNAKTLLRPMAEALPWLVGEAQRQ